MATRHSTLVVSAVHTPQMLPRIVAAVTGCGFAIERLHSGGKGSSERAMVVVEIVNHLASRDTSHLARIVSRNVEVHWARTWGELPFPMVRSELSVIDRYEVCTRHVSDRLMSDARLVAVRDGRRYIGAAEDFDPVQALVGAFHSALQQIGGEGDPAVTITDRWESQISPKALVLAELDGLEPSTRPSAIGAGRNALEATAMALETALAGRQTTIDLISA